MHRGKKWVNLASVCKRKGIAGCGIQTRLKPNGRGPSREETKLGRVEDAPAKRRKKTCEPRGRPSNAPGWPAEMGQNRPGP